MDSADRELQRSRNRLGRLFTIYCGFLNTYLGYKYTELWAQFKPEEEEHQV